MRAFVSLVLLSVLVSGCGGSGSTTEASGTTTQAAPAPLKGPAPHWKAWLCKPGLKLNWCHPDMDVTVIAADGSRRIVRAPVAPKQPIDCFYVYPTVSRDPARQLRPRSRPGGEADGRSSRRRGSASRAGSTRPSTGSAPCTPAASAAAAGSPTATCSLPGATTWRTTNHGRGVVLIGHSQGARHPQAVDP